MDEGVLRGGQKGHSKTKGDQAYVMEGCLGETKQGICSAFHDAPLLLATVRGGRFHYRDGIPLLPPPPLPASPPPSGAPSIEDGELGVLRKGQLSEEEHVEQHAQCPHVHFGVDALPVVQVPHLQKCGACGWTGPTSAKVWSVVGPELIDYLAPLLPTLQASWYFLVAACVLPPFFLTPIPSPFLP